MKSRYLLVVALLAALAGLVVLVVQLIENPPERDYETTIEPPRTWPGQEVPDDLEASAGSGTLRGKVVNGLTDEPIPGARVEALHRYEREEEGEELPLWGELKVYARVTTDDDGTFAVEDLPKDYWNLWVEKRGYAWTTVPRAKFDRTHTIRLYPGCRVYGRVVYPDESPAEGVRIEYTPQGTNSEVFGRYPMKGLEAYYTTTKADGTFEYDDLPPGKFTVEVYAQDHLPAPWTHEPPLKPGDVRDLGTQKLDGGFTMKVQVKWRGTNRGVPDVEVVARPVGDPMPRTKIGQRRRTDANGVAHFKGLGGQTIERPRFSVAANVDGVGPVVPDEPGLLEPGSDVTIYLRRAGILKGKVLDPRGEPIDLFWVQLEALGFITRQLRVAGHNGEFKVHGVPEGSYNLHIKHKRFVDAVLRVDAVAGEEVDVGTVELRGGAEIYGTVTRSNGAPLEGVVKVRLGRKQRIASGHEVYTMVAQAAALSDGSYSLSGIPPGTYDLWPESFVNPSGVTDPVRVEVRPGVGGIQKDLVIEGEGFLKLVFMDLVEGQQRQARPPKTFLIETATGKETRWFSEGTRLRSGSYEIWVELADAEGVSQRYKAREVRVQEGETTGPIELRLFEIRDG